MKINEVVLHEIERAPVNSKVALCTWSSVVLSSVLLVELFDVNVTPLCIEVNSQQISQSSISEKNNEYDSLIIPLSKRGQPLISQDDVDKFNVTSESGNVETKLVLKIPSFNK